MTHSNTVSKNTSLATMNVITPTFVLTNRINFYKFSVHEVKTRWNHIRAKTWTQFTPIGDST